MTNRHAKLSLVGLSALYFAVVIAVALSAPLTHDEFYTLYLARLPSLSELWASLQNSIDFHPPLHYLFTRFAMQLVGENSLALRSVSILAGFFFVVGLFKIASRRLPFYYALFAALIPLTAGAHSYFFVARSYMLMLALATWGFYFWIQAKDARFGAKHIIAAVFFFLACSSHYYAGLLFAGLYLTELEHVWLTRKVRYQNVLPLVVATAFSLAVVLPLALHARSYSQTFWGHVGPISLLKCYNFFLGDRTIVLWAVIGLALIYLVKRHRPGSPLPLKALWDKDERLLFVTLALTPVVGVILGMVFKAGFSERYVAVSLVGIAILIATFAFRKLHHVKQAIGVINVLTLIWIGALWAKDYRWMSEQTALIRRDVRSLLAQSSTLPVVIGHVDIFMQYEFYAPPKEQGRIHFMNSKEFVSLYNDQKQCAFQTEALLDAGHVATDPESFLKEHTRYLCLLGELDRETPNVLRVSSKNPLNWKVGEYQLYECKSDASPASRVSKF